MSDSELSFSLPMEAEAVQPQGMAGVFALKGKLLAAIEATLDRYRTKGLKLPPKDEFLAKAKTFMEGVAAMVDIPGIGPIIEAKLEEYLIAALMPVVAKLYDRFAPA